MHNRSIPTRLLISFGCTVMLLASGAAAQSWLTDGDKPDWLLALSAGYDATVQTYYLAETDTTETLSEWLAAATVEGRSARKAKNRWLVRGKLSAGTEMFRQRLEADYSLRDSNRNPRLRLEGYFWGRQFREDAENTTSSNNWEGRLRLRTYPLINEQLALEIRGYGSFIDYRTPSTLEQDYHELAAGTFLRSRGLDQLNWYGGVRYKNRVYPDTTEIDRDALSAEGEIDYQNLDGGELRVFHKSERRLMADETVRPSAWTHWTELKSAISAGSGFVILDLLSEIWTYDYETSAYYDSRLTRGLAGYRWGDIMRATWRVGLTGEWLDAGDNPESYDQVGVQFGVESYASAVSGSAVLEYGRRIYDSSDIVYDITDDGGNVLYQETVALYSDYNYWKIWLMGSWAISRQLSLDILASYVPESHTEQEDDSALGFASLRLVWRR